MNSKDLSYLFILASIWGGSFIFMHVAAPVFGPVATADLRILIAGIVLCSYFSFQKINLEWRDNWKEYLGIGIVNSAIPFALYSYAAMHIPTGYSVILNSTSPLFGGILSHFILQDKFSAKKFLGVMLGTTGVTFVSKVGASNTNPAFKWSIIACLGASFCYAITGVYLKSKKKKMNPLGIAGGSQLLAGLFFLPLIYFFPITGIVTTKVALNLLALSFLCSAVAYVLYFKLINSVGATKALTVTFLMPLFGMLWGLLFLGEVISWDMILGAFLILIGTYFSLV